MSRLATPHCILLGRKTSILWRSYPSKSIMQRNWPAGLKIWRGVAAIVPRRSAWRRPHGKGMSGSASWLLCSYSDPLLHCTALGQMGEGSLGAACASGSSTESAWATECSEVSVFMGQQLHQLTAVVVQWKYTRGHHDLKGRECLSACSVC